MFILVYFLSCCWIGYVVLVILFTGTLLEIDFELDIFAVFDEAIDMFEEAFDERLAAIVLGSYYLMNYVHFTAVSWATNFYLILLGFLKS